MLQCVFLMMNAYFSKAWVQGREVHVVNNQER